MTHDIDPRVDARDNHGPFDIIGDVHGCHEELRDLLERLGYLFSPELHHPQGRQLLFLGDLVDRGPGSPEVLDLVRASVAGGQALCIRGNHDDKLLRWMKGNPVKVRLGLEVTVAQIEAHRQGAERQAWMEVTLAFLEALPDHLLLDGGRLVAAHAGLPEAYHGRQDAKVRHLALFGQSYMKQLDANGYPLRVDWAADYAGAAHVVHGHTPVQEPVWRNRVLCLDTGCVFGGALTALSWPEMTFTRVSARQTYFDYPMAF